MVCVSVWVSLRIISVSLMLPKVMVILGFIIEPYFL